MYAIQTLSNVGMHQEALSCLEDMAILDDVLAEACHYQAVLTSVGQVLQFILILSALELLLEIGEPEIVMILFLNKSPLKHLILTSDCPP